MPIRVKYRSIFTPGTNDLTPPMPFLDVEIKGSRSSIGMPALVDSGATSTVFPFGVDTEIGLECSSSCDVKGIGGKSELTRTKANLTILNGTMCLHRLKDCPIMVASQETQLDFAILGRDTVFRLSRITFCEDIQEIWLKRC